MMSRVWKVGRKRSLAVLADQNQPLKFGMGKAAQPPFSCLGVSSKEVTNAGRGQRYLPTALDKRPGGMLYLLDSV
jgi:hypothetical protein